MSNTASQTSVGASGAVVELLLAAGAGAAVPVGGAAAAGAVDAGLLSPNILLPVSGSIMSSPRFSLGSTHNQHRWSRNHLISLSVEYLELKRGGKVYSEKNRL